MQLPWERAEREMLVEVARWRGQAQILFLQQWQQQSVVAALGLT